ncbi:MAG: FimV/HubP family polar landmark protein [Gammaproteobacteria bacterium]
MRNLTKTLAVLSLLAPAGAYSLGVGDIKLHSALNQKLNADIALSLGAGENIADIRVKLAPIEKFDQAGIPWSHFLTKIKFEPVVRRNGSIVIKLTTQEAIAEPFLDFLLEVSSPEGSQYREFTVLIDPPASYEHPFAPATALPAITAKRSGVPTQPYSRGRAARTSSPAYSGSGVSAEAVGSGDTVRVRRNDTLSSIAARVNAGADISREQMAIALFNANPQAFYKNNINALSAGSTLHVPGRETILRLSRRQAIEEFRQQNAAWRGEVSVASKVQEPLSEEAKLTLAAPAEAEISEDVQAAAAAEEASPKPPVSASAVQSAESQLLQERLHKLEQQMAEMQKIIALKDQQLAALQSGRPLPPEALAVEPQQPEIPAPQPEAVKPQPEVPAAQPEAAKPPPVTPVTKPEAPVPTAVAPKPVTPPRPARPVAPQKAVAPAEEETETSMLSYTIFGVTGLGMLGLFAWLWIRKRKIEEEQNRESMFASSSQISLPATDDELLVPNVIDDTHSYGVSPVGVGSSFLTDFSSDFTIFDTDQNEVDPISEADVYLAYGRYQQAEELMRNAIAEQPDRDECKLKLLEIYFTGDNKQAFEDYAEELAAAGKKNDDKFWSRVKEMGVEIVPDSALFADAKLPGSSFLERPARKDESAPQETESDAEEEQAAVESEDVLALEPEQEQQDSAKTADDNAEKAYDFDLSSVDITVEDEVVGNTESTTEDIETFDFNLDFDDATATGGIEAVVLDKEGDSIESLENFDFFGSADSGGADEISIQEADETLELTSDAFENESNEAVPLDLDIDAFGELELDLESESAPSFSDDFSEENAIDLSEEKGFIPLEELDDEPTESLHDLDFGGGFNLTDMDELETKIDLAKAYIDMGDTEAAKEIAEDVLARGNTDQKREAQAIIDGL